MPPGFGTTGQPLQRAGPPMPPGFQQRPSPNFTATAQQFVGMQSYSAPAGPIIPAKMRTEALAAAAAMANPAPKPDAAAEGEGGVDADQKKKPKPNRMAAGRKWHDPDMDAFEKGDFRIFCGDLGNEVSDEGLARGFSKYPSVLKARVVRDKRTGKSRGYGFVSFKDPQEYMKAMKEMNGKYIGNRPVKLRKSTWKDRDSKVVKKKEFKKKTTLGVQSSTLLYQGNRSVPQFS